MELHTVNKLFLELSQFATATTAREFELKREIQDLLAENEKLEKAIRETIEDNLHLADGEICTLIKLKRAINYS